MCTVDGLTRAAGIFMTNCFDMTDSIYGESCAMYLALARLNHSCCPNVQVRVASTNSWRYTVCAVALQGIDISLLILLFSLLPQKQNYFRRQIILLFKITRFVCTHITHVHELIRAYKYVCTYLPTYLLTYINIYIYICTYTVLAYIHAIKHILIQLRLVWIGTRSKLITRIPPRRCFTPRGISAKEKK